MGESPHPAPPKPAGRLELNQTTSALREPGVSVAV